MVLVLAFWLNGWILSDEDGTIVEWPSYQIVQPVIQERIIELPLIVESAGGPRYILEQYPVRRTRWFWRLRRLGG